MVIKGKSVKFNENVATQSSEPEKKEDEEGANFSEKKNYSLDSDEEEDVSSKKLNVDDIDGQEATTMRQDGEQVITPFNLEDENEEGHFDENGNFIFDKKTGEEIRDSWLDSIDMQKLPTAVPKETVSKESTPDPLSKLSPTEILTQIVAILKPSESVTKALKRLGGTQLSASQRLKLKKKGQLATNSQADKELLEKLTSLSDWLLHQGRDTIYQDTYEKLNHEIKQASEDIFGDMDEEKGDNDGSSRSKRQKVDESSVSTELNWFYKTEGVTHGPLSSSEMFKMQNESAFKPGTKVCKETNKEVFYDAKRMNFDDYID